MISKFNKVLLSRYELLKNFQVIAKSSIFGDDTTISFHLQQDTVSRCSLSAWVPMAVILRFQSLSPFKTNNYPFIHCKYWLNLYSNSNTLKSYDYLFSNNWFPPIYISLIFALFFCWKESIKIGSTPPLSLQSKQRSMYFQLLSKRIFCLQPLYPQSCKLPIGS